MALFVLAVVVVALALLPGSIEGPGLGWDKANHAVAFATLAICGVYGLRGRPAAMSKLAAWLVLLGVGIEVAQWFTPDRQAEWQDVVADVAGVAAGMSAALWVAAALDRRRAPRPEDTPR